MATQAFDKPSQFREELDKAFRKNKKSPSLARGGIFD